MSTKVKLKDVRISYPRLFEAMQYQGKGKARYDCVFIIEPGSENDKAIRAAIKLEAETLWQKKAQAKIESFGQSRLQNCYTNGDNSDDEVMAGKMLLSTHRREEDGPPTILDRDKSPLTAKSGRPYAGCYVNASVAIYCQDGERNGIRCGLAGVQFFRDGVAFSGAVAASPDEFDDLGMEDEDDMAL